MRVMKLDTRQPFTRAQALAAGLDPCAAQPGRFVRLLRSVYVDARVTNNPLVRVRAALAQFEGRAFASHVSAAREI